MSPRIRTASGAAFEPRGTFHEHIIAIHELAHDFDLSEPTVADIYWPELARLQEGATIDVYLPLLTERRVRERLWRSGKPDETRRSEAHEDELVAG
jgi:hypothetical protein